MAPAVSWMPFARRFVRSACAPMFLNASKTTSFLDRELAAAWREWILAEVEKDFRTVPANLQIYKSINLQVLDTLQTHQVVVHEVGDSNVNGLIPTALTKIQWFDVPAVLQRCCRRPLLLFDPVWYDLEDIHDSDPMGSFSCQKSDLVWSSVPWNRLAEIASAPKLHIAKIAKALVWLPIATLSAVLKRVVTAKVCWNGAYCI